jgi:hypothetical protein
MAHLYNNNFEILILIYCRKKHENHIKITNYIVVDRIVD